MKLLRLCLLVVLAVLLPVRGAMAATMPCAPEGGQHSTSRADHAVDHAHAGEDRAHEAHAAAPHDDGEGAHDHPTADRCDLCSASCSSVPLPSAAAGIAEPAILASLSFADLGAPSPTFESGGPERPPRTC